MHASRLLATLLAALTCVCGASGRSNLLVSSAGDTAIIPGWSLQSATRLPDDLSSLSTAGVDVSSWYRMGARGSVMAGLIENGVYNETDLFYSDNLNAVAGHPIFNAPWLYREEFPLHPSDGKYFLLKTHGITSKADIYVNGYLVASSEDQQGSYGGHQYNVTEYAQEGVNCLLIRTHSTNYRRDFAMTFADWNPSPPDNGTGVWRYVELSQTGSVSMSPLRVLTDFMKSGTYDKVNVTVRTDLINWAAKATRVMVNGTVKTERGFVVAQFADALDLGPNEKKTVSLTSPLENPQIWWPAGWGDQPLYFATATAFTEDAAILSDISGPQHFGIRRITSSLHSDDIAFSINGKPFQVMGAGYAPDMFMRFDAERVRTIFNYMLDIGINTVRLEGKQEHPELYTLADCMGMMILAGWECCDKWEAWKYNDDADGVKWQEKDYQIAKVAMLHETQMMQTHPSILGFLVGSDYWPNEHATKVYLDALSQMDWPSPVIASASKRGYPEALGPSGMKMEGPYDWVPPNYWYGSEQGAAFGFGSELGGGVGTPEVESLRKFMSDDDLNMLWTQPDAGLYHMSTNISQFYDRSIYNKALFARYGAPDSLEDYILKSQMADYEATRAEFEAYSANQNASRPATGLIYWMLNSAWPNLHWQLFDYYLSPMGSYFGTKVGARMEHVAYNYQDQTVSLINHSLNKKGPRQIFIDLIDRDGKRISRANVKATTIPNSSKQVQSVPGLNKIKDIAFLRLILRDQKLKRNLSRNVYWITSTADVLAWEDSNWYYTPVAEYADYTALGHLSTANVKVSLRTVKSQSLDERTSAEVLLENKSKVPAVFIRLHAVNSSNGAEIMPVYWSDNYVTLWPYETLRLSVAFENNLKHTNVEISGKNVKKTILKAAGSK